MDDKAPKPPQYDWLTLANELAAVAQNGLTFADDPFDVERYHQIRSLSASILTHHTGLSEQSLNERVFCDKGYATPKVDVRGAAFKDGKILLVKERQDGLWTLPGGYSEINHTPAQSMEKEFIEETGFEGKVTKLVALLDKQRHPHPKQVQHIYKCFFLVEIQSGQATPNLEISDIDFFGLDDLPPLSTPRILASQIKLCFEHHQNPHLPCLFD